MMDILLQFCYFKNILYSYSLKTMPYVFIMHTLLCYHVGFSKIEGLDISQTHKYMNPCPNFQYFISMKNLLKLRLAESKFSIGFF